jgi:2-dehydro-3-deoxyphosphogluconate aldolase/(4S)-4-hydroxy-2-oxoglutarate aldolase
MSGNKGVSFSILSNGMLPLYYCNSLTVSLDIARVLHRAGVGAIEYTNRGPAALENFTAMKKTLAEELPGLHLGIGTVKSQEEAEAYVLAGADFIVSPIVNPAVAAVAKAAGLLWIPGCMTPTEIYLAQELGAQIIKLFPANILTPEFLRSILGLFRGQKFIPTGGVEIDERNIREWYEAGVVAVGMGSKLITEEIIVHGYYDLLHERTLLALSMVRKVKQEMNR